MPRMRSSGMENSNPSVKCPPRKGPPPLEKTAPPKTVVVMRVSPSRRRWKSGCSGIFQRLFLSHLGGEGKGSGGGVEGSIGRKPRETCLGQLAEVLARLESDRVAGRDGHLDSGLGIASDAALATLDLEDAEAA